MRIALIGIEHWHAEMHAQAAKTANATLIGVWGTDVDAAQIFAKRHDCPSLTSLEQVLDLKPDLVVVMGRPEQIAARGLKAIEHAIPTLIEKPIGTSAADVDPLIKAAAQNKCFVAMALPHGLNMMAAVRELDEAGRFGAVSHSHFRLINGPPQRYVNDGVAWVLDRTIGGGGALRNLGIHGINGFLTLVGDQEVRVEQASFGRQIHGTDVEDYAAIILRAADDTLGIIEAGYTFASMTSGLFEWRIASQNASLTDTGDTIAIVTLDDAASRTIPATPVANRYDDVMADTLNRVRSNQQPAVSLQDSWRAMHIIDQCYALQNVEK